MVLSASASKRHRRHACSPNRSNGLRNSSRLWIAALVDNPARSGRRSRASSSRPAIASVPGTPLVQRYDHEIGSRRRCRAPRQTARRRGRRRVWRNRSRVPGAGRCRCDQPAGVRAGAELVENREGKARHDRRAGPARIGSGFATTAWCRRRTGSSARHRGAPGRSRVGGRTVDHDGSTTIRRSRRTSRCRSSALPICISGCRCSYSMPTARSSPRIRSRLWRRASIRPPNRCSVKSLLKDAPSRAFDRQQFTRAKIVWSTAPGLTVTRVAVSRVSGQSSASSSSPRGPGSAARQRPVQVGEILGDDYVVKGGLKAGEPRRHLGRPEAGRQRPRRRQ